MPVPASAVQIPEVLQDACQFLPPPPTGRRISISDNPDAFRHASADGPVPHQGVRCTIGVRFVETFAKNARFGEIVSKRTRRAHTAFDMRRVHRYYAPRSHDSSVVQSVERRTVNPYVTGSSPVRGAKFRKACFRAGFLLFCARVFAPSKPRTSSILFCQRLHFSQQPVFKILERRFIYSRFHRFN